MGWEDATHRFEWVWRTLRAVAEPARRESECFALLIGDLSRGADVPVNDYSVAGLLESWELVLRGNKKLAQAALEWTNSEFAQRLPQARERLLTVLRRAQPSLAPLPAPTPSSFQSIVTRIDDAILGVEEISIDEGMVIEELLQKEMKRVRDSAAIGAYGGGGVSSAELSAAFAIKTSSPIFWSPLLDLLLLLLLLLLLDPNVQQEDKERALDRMAQAPNAIPDPVRKRILGKEASLLTGGPSWRGQELIPFPPALRLLGKHSDSSPHQSAYVLLPS